MGFFRSLLDDTSSASLSPLHIGIGAATGAMILSVLLGCAFISRQFRGAFADRHGGLKTVLAGSAFQAASIGTFLLTQNEAGLFVVAAGYEFGFSSIIPAYVVSIRDLFPSAEAQWRIPLVLFTAMSGMAVGSQGVYMIILASMRWHSAPVSYLTLSAWYYSAS